MSVTSADIPGDLLALTKTGRVQWERWIPINPKPGATWNEMQRVPALEGATTGYVIRLWGVRLTLQPDGLWAGSVEWDCESAKEIFTWLETRTNAEFTVRRDGEPEEALQELAQRLRSMLG